MRPTTDHRGPTHVDEELQRHHHEDEQADAPPQGGVIDEREKAGAKGESRQDAWHKRADQRPIGVVPVVPDGEDVADDEHHEDGRRRFPRRQQARKDRHADDRHPADGRLRIADDERGERHQRHGRHRCTLKGVPDWSRPVTGM